MSIQHAIVLHHTSSPQPILEAAPMEYVPHGEDFGRAYERREELPLPTRTSIMAAWRASNEERKASGIDPHPMPYSLMATVIAEHEEMRRLNAQDALVLLIEEHGLVQVKRWIRNIALLKGGE